MQGSSLRNNDRSIDQAFMLNEILYQTCLIFCHFITAITLRIRAKYMFQLVLKVIFFNEKEFCKKKAKNHTLNVFVIKMK